MWDPSEDKDIECAAMEIDNLTELLSLMNSSFKVMSKGQTETLLGLALNLSSNVFIWMKEEEKRHEKQHH
ncbi:hypothetical protein [Citrobacter freundii]|uniref:hypothetical protein n=1 Tax=Citrobacter freundii TaxID=546 RepID=UPI00388CFD8D|nr:hypothetical protein [Citrobacter freundii]HCC5797172.1 hypothetical protein [Citrobacter freundii]HCC6885689.1 hypothetical protein [Citrobacter freundii]HCC7971286.1 hypothetical protein [Citrobacter freundii]